LTNIEASPHASGLGEHVERGMPHAEVDVERVWWLIDVLVRTGVLAQQILADEARVPRGRGVLGRALAPVFKR
jgi:hypothetical protein